MNSGKALRLRRVFANGRALVVDCAPIAEDPAARVRTLARAGVDAVVLTPGLLDVVAEELGALSVILRVDSGVLPTRRLMGVQSALALGADGILAGAGREDFPQLTEEARRCGMPVFAEIGGQNWLEAARLAADCGADVIQAPCAPDREGRLFQRMTGRAFLATVSQELEGVLETIHETMEGAAQGVVLASRKLIGPSMLAAIHALVHQGVSAEEAMRIAAVESE